MRLRKVIRSGATEVTCDRTTQPGPKIDPWRSDLDAMLAETSGRPKRERPTLGRICEELRNRGYGGGYDGGYDAVRRYAVSWSKATPEASAAAYVPLSFEPGEACRFDWRHEGVTLDGVTTTVKVAHARLSHSSACTTAGCRSCGPIDVRPRNLAIVARTNGAPNGAILNILARHREPPPPLTVTMPDALKLACEPAANCDRYNSLRRQTDGTLRRDRRDRRDGEVEALRHEGVLRRDYRNRPRTPARAAADHPSLGRRMAKQSARKGPGRQAGR